MSGFTLRQFAIFAQVVEHGSFRRCAEQLGISQVSISEHVRGLEARLGVRLFDRHAGGPATLTAEGERAHRRIVAILADVGALVAEVADRRGGSRRRLTAAMHAYFMRYLRDAVAEFRSQHADVDVGLDLEIARPEALYERVQCRELDVAYFFAFDGYEVPGSEFVRLERLAIFVGQDHPLARKERVTVADIRATPSIHLTPRNPLRALVDRALAQAGMDGSPVGLETDEYGLILTSVHRNYGFSCLLLSADPEVAAGSGIVPLRLEHPIPALQVRRITRRSARNDPLTIDFIERLTRTLRAA